MSALVSVSASTADAVLLHAAVLGVAAYLVGRSAWWWAAAAFEWIERHAHRSRVESVAEAVREHTWPGMAPLLEVPPEPAGVVAGVLPEEPVETSQPRHARVEPDDTETGLLPVVAGAASGQDGVS